MISVLRYGDCATVSIEIGSESLLASCNAPRGAPVACLAEAVDSALAAPLDFPPLSKAAVPGDKVVLAIERGVPGVSTIVARTVAVLLASGVSAGEITLLQSEGDDEADILSELSTDVRSAIAHQVHQPESRDSLSYLAASADAQPIYINRAIHDADVVISMGCLRLAGSPGYFGAGSTLYPTFSNVASIERYRVAGLSSAAERKCLDQQLEEVSWLLGAPLTIQVVPGQVATGSGPQVLHVLAGEKAAVFRVGSQLYEEAWAYSVPRRARLVIAALEGGPRHQTWNNLARALAAAGQAVSDDGSIVVCTELSGRLGSALQHMIGSEDLDMVLRQIHKHKPVDALAGIELIRALKRGKVYLLSNLDEELVEELGMLPVTSDQISRLVARFDSCVVLAHAQNAVARPRHEAVPEAMAATRKLRK